MEKKRTVKRIDAHAHIVADDPEMVAFLDERELKVHNISLVPLGADDWYTEGGCRAYYELAVKYPDHFAWCTTFDLPTFDDPNYVSDGIAQLERDFADGATGCKVWRNIGMEVRKPSGEYILIDDPLFEPIFSYIASAGKSLLMHVGEPLARWPGERDELAGRTGQKTPNYSVLKNVDYPGYWEQIEARDHVLERHPDLKVIGAHFGSLEHDLHEVAKRLDRYPNFAVDTGGRRRDLACQDRDTVRQFIIDYQDRILWGMDQGTGDSRLCDFDDEKRAWFFNMMREGYAYEFNLYEGSGPVPVDQIEAQGLDLPDDVLEKIYYTNARTWYPGIFQKEA